MRASIAASLDPSSDGWVGTSLARWDRPSRHSLTLPTPLCICLSRLPSLAPALVQMELEAERERDMGVAPARQAGGGVCVTHCPPSRHLCSNEARENQQDRATVPIVLPRRLVGACMSRYDQVDGARVQERLSRLLCAAADTLRQAQPSATLARTLWPGVPAAPPSLGTLRACLQAGEAQEEEEEKDVASRWRPMRRPLSVSSLAALVHVHDTFMPPSLVDTLVHGASGTAEDSLDWLRDERARAASLFGQQETEAEAMLGAILRGMNER
uniref:Uncharacterized protein n=1 Tax=Sexangularia sp. CB-2014 TaxID=1486929 RepID=A0A7S1VAX6_9EUKA